MAGGSPNYSVSAENTARTIRASQYAAEYRTGCTIVKDNGTTGFGAILAGTPMGKVTASGKFRPCGKGVVSAGATSATIALGTDNGQNFYVGDSVNVYSTLGVLGAVTMDATGGETIVITGKTRDGLAHTLALVDPSLGGQSLSQSVSVNPSTGVATIAINLATAQPTLTIVCCGSAETIVVTSKNGKLHAVALVDPSANDQALAQDVVFDANGVGTIRILLATNGGGTITSTVAQVLAELNSDVSGSIVTCALGTAEGDETAIAVASAPLAGDAITSTITQVLAEINSGEASRYVGAALGSAEGDETAIAVAASPLAGGLAPGAALLSASTISALNKSANPNTITVGSSITVVSGDTVQLANGAQNAVGLLYESNSTYDAKASEIAQASTYRDASGEICQVGLFTQSKIVGYNTFILADLGGVDLGTVIKL